MRILLVTPASPFTPRSGAEQRTALLRDALAEKGEVDVLLLEPGDETRVASSPDPRILARACWRNLPLGIAKYRPDETLTRQVNEIAPLVNYDLIVGRYLNPICKLRLPRGVKTLVDLDDWGYRYGGDAWWTPKGAVARAKSAYAKALARAQLRRFDAFFFTSQRDRVKEPGVEGMVLSNVPFSPPAAPLPPTDSKNILFVGALWYGPNRHGIAWFLKHCWPRIRAHVPEATLTLVGAAPEKLRADWERLPGVKAPGFVEDLSAAYRNAAFTIAPIHYGGGTNIKILESLAYGRACVATPHASEAFAQDLVKTGALLVAPDDVAFSDACIQGLRTAGVGREALQDAHEMTARLYSPEAFRATVHRLTGRLLGGSSFSFSNATVQESRP